MRCVYGFRETLGGHTARSHTGAGERDHGITPIYNNVLQMVKRRAEDADFDPDQVCGHTLRGTGITTYLENRGKLETAQHIAGHASATTTKLYNRRNQNVQ